MVCSPPKNREYGQYPPLKSRDPSLRMFLTPSLRIFFLFFSPVKGGGWVGSDPYWKIPLFFFYSFPKEKGQNKMIKCRVMNKICLVYCDKFNVTNKMCQQQCDKYSFTDLM